MQIMTYFTELATFCSEVFHCKLKTSYLNNHYVDHSNAFHIVNNALLCQYFASTTSVYTLCVCLLLQLMWLFISHDMLLAVINDEHSFL